MTTLAQDVAAKLSAMKAEVDRASETIVFVTKRKDGSWDIKVRLTYE